LSTILALYSGPVFEVRTKFDKVCITQENEECEVATPFDPFRVGGFFLWSCNCDFTIESGDTVGTASFSGCRVQVSVIDFFTDRKCVAFQELLSFFFVLLALFLRFFLCFFFCRLLV
jgi:hypothetical protein